MNLVLKNLLIKGFQSVDEIQLDLKDRGITVVKGINNYENNVKSNGSGKSSIFESIIFALYGETSLGIKDPENRILKNGYRVVLDFEVNGIDYTICRIKEKDKSTVELWQYTNGMKENISGRNKTDTEKIIQNTLGINKELFLDSIFLAQGISTNLSSLSPTARKERLEILTGTEQLIEEFKAYIKDRQLKYEAKCTELTLEKSKLEGNKTALAGQISTLKSKINEIEQENERKKQQGSVEQIEEKINEKNTEISVIENDIVNIENHINSNLKNSIQKDQVEIDKLKEQKRTIEEEKEIINDKLNTQRDVVHNIDTKLNSLNNDKTNHERDIQKTQAEIEEIRKSDTCPTCGRKYDNANEAHILETINKKNVIIENSTNAINEIVKNINDISQQMELEVTKGKQIREEYDNKQAQIENINNLIQEKESQTNKTNNEIENQRNLISNKQSQIKEIQNNIKELQAKKEELLKVEIISTTEYEKMIQDADNNIENIDTQIDTLQKEYMTQDDLVSVCKYILQLTTKQFRTYLLQNSIKLLNSKLEELSKRLFSNVKDVITIDGDDSKLDIKLGDAPYESLSGGEKTRVNMCLLLAQKYLASSLGNIDCNVIILDEVLGQCDSEAEMNIIDLIIEELQSVSSIIFIGHKEIQLPHDDIITVVKDENGLSRLLNM